MVELLVEVFNDADPQAAELARIRYLLDLAVSRAASVRARTRPREDDGDIVLAVQARAWSSSGSEQLDAAREQRLVAERLIERASRQRAAPTYLQGPFDTLIARLKLGRNDLDVLLLAFLRECDLDVARRFDAIDPDSHGELTVQILVAVLGGGQLQSASPEIPLCLVDGAPLIEYGILRTLSANDEPSPLVRCRYRLDAHALSFLAGAPRSDRALRPYARWVEPRCSLDDVLLPATLKLQVATRCAANSRHIVYLHGPSGVGKRTLAAAAVSRQDAPLIAVDCISLRDVPVEALGSLMRAIRREAALHRAFVLWIDGDALLSEGSQVARSALRAALASSERPVLVSGTRGHLQGTIDGVQILPIEIPRPGPATQRSLWERALGLRRGPDVDLAALTGLQKLTGGPIREIVEAARGLADLRGGTEAPILMTDLLMARHQQHGERLPALGRRGESTARWDDLVLPPDRKAALRELCIHFRHRVQVFENWGFHRKFGEGRPLAALFAGPPGTGKTMAAGVVSGELGVELYHVDLSRVVSKYIGETEKHLAELFDAAEAAGAALFFDEADTLFSKRTEVRDSHDRYANLETGYLLQRIESYDGLVILATNLLKNIDDAFVRRFGFIIEFQLPAPAERLQIWQKIWPAEAPLSDDVDLPFLAQRIEHSGGYIRNIALAAAFLAAEEGGAIAMRHVLHAARREYQKMGKVFDLGKLAPAR